MPLGNPGDLKLLGGEFILGPGQQCSFTHRMVTVRGHLDIARILGQAGVDLDYKSPPDVIEEDITRPSSSTSRRASSAAGYYDTERSQRPESTKSTGPRRRLKSLFGTRTAKSGAEESDSELEYADAAAPRSASAMGSASKGGKERLVWNLFSSKGKRDSNAHLAPPMPDNAAANAQQFQRVSESRLSEPREELETLEVSRAAGGRSNVSSPAPYSSARQSLDDQAEQAPTPTPSGLTSFRELTAAALRPMRKLRSATPAGDEAAVSGAVQQDSASSSIRGSVEMQEELSISSRRPAGARKVLLSDISRSQSQMMFNDEARSETGTERNRLSTAESFTGGQSPALSMFNQYIFNQNGRSTSQRTSPSQTPRRSHEAEGSGDYDMDKDLPAPPRSPSPPRPRSPPGFDAFASGSFLDGLDAVDGLRRGSVGLGGGNSREQSDDLYFDGSDNEASRRAQDSEPSDLDPVDEPQDSTNDDTVSGSDRAEVDDEEDDEETIDAHGKKREEDALVDDEDLSDSDEMSDEEYNSRQLLGNGLSASSIRPSLSPTPEEEDEEEEEEIETPDTSPGNSSNSSPYNNYGSRSHFKSGNLVRAPSGNLGTFMEEEEEEEEDDEEGRGEEKKMKEKAVEA